MIKEVLMLFVVIFALMSTAVFAQFDRDGDTFCNGAPDDSDGDGMKDKWEKANGLNPFDKDDAYADFDGDALLNIEEHDQGLDPRKEDSDNDGTGDYLEINEYGTDPTDPDSKPRSKTRGIIIGAIIVVGFFVGYKIFRKRRSGRRRLPKRTRKK